MLRPLVLIALLFVSCTHDTQKTSSASPNMRKPSQIQSWQICMDRICGDELGGYTARLQKVYQRLIQDQGFVADVKSGSAQAFDARVAEARLFAKVIDQELTSGTVLTAHFDKLLALLPGLLEALKHVSLDEDLKFDVQRTVDALAASGVNLPSQRVPLFLKLAEVLLKAEMPKLFEGEVGLLKELFNDRELRAMVEQTINSMVQMENSIAQRFHVKPEVIFQTTLSDRERLRRLRSGEMTAHDLDQLKDDYRSVAQINAMLESSELEQLVPQGPIPLKDLLDQNFHTMLREKIRTFDLHLTDPDAPTSPLVNKKAGVIATCRSYAAFGEELSPTRRQIQDFQRREPALRTEYMNKLSSKISQPAAVKLKAHAASWVFRAPSNIQHYKEVLLGEIRDIAVSARESIAMASDTDPKIKRIVFVSALAQLSDLEGDRYDSVLTEACTEQMVTPFPDAAYIGHRLFTVGPVTLVDEEMTRLVLFHEYSHLVSGHIQANAELKSSVEPWYSSTRQCLASLHDKDGENFQEEDWADMLASAFETRLPKHYCHVMNASASDFTRVIEGSRHSTDLHRHFTALASRGLPLPPVCDQALSEKGEHRRFRSCLYP